MYIHVYIIIYVYVGLYVNFTINVERIFFFFLNKWDDAPLGDGSLHKLCTLRIGSSGTAYQYSLIKEKLKRTAFI